MENLDEKYVDNRDRSHEQEYDKNGTPYTDEHYIMLNGVRTNIFKIRTPETDVALTEWVIKQPSPEPTPWTVIEADLKKLADMCDFDIDGRHHQFYFEKGIKKYYDGWDGSNMDHKFMNTGIRTLPETR